MRGPADEAKPSLYRESVHSLFVRCPVASDEYPDNLRALEKFSQISKAESYDSLEGPP